MRGFVIGLLMAVVGIFTVSHVFKSDPGGVTLAIEKQVPVNEPIAGPAPAPIVERVAEARKVEKMDLLVLGESNTISLRGPVTDQSIANLQEELYQKSAELPESETIYLVLDTPGGSVPAGNSFIDAARAIPQKVKTITLFAASMGFHIAQNLGERLILPSGTLMSHRATVQGLGGEVPGELVTRLNFLLKMLNDMDASAASRMTLPVSQYQNMIHDEYWTYGRSAIDEKAADRVVLARCGKSLMGSSEQDVDFLFFTAKMTFSKCPLIQGPLKVKVSQGQFKNKAEVLEAQKTLHNYLYDKRRFIKENIITGRFQPRIEN